MSKTANNSVPLDPSQPPATVELKVSILHSTPDVTTLQNLIQSSPLYRAAYLDDQKAILSTVLLRDIGPHVLTDALAVHQATNSWSDGSDKGEQIVSRFITKYKIERGSSLPPEIDLGTLESLSRFHQVVARITSDFCEATLSVDPVSGNSIKPNQELSDNEKRRIHRALYRFELFRVLFSDPRSERTSPIIQLSLDSSDRSFLFLAILNPWEVEEIACVRDYILKRHTQILAESSSELSKLRPGKDFQNEFYRVGNIGYFMSQGPKLLCRLLNTSSAVQKASILEYKLMCDHYLTQELEESPFDEVYQTDLYFAAENGQELLFADGGDSFVHEPNAAWTWSTIRKLKSFILGRKRRR